MTGMYLEHYGVKGMKWRTHRKASDFSVKKSLSVVTATNFNTESDRSKRLAQMKLAKAQYQDKNAGHGVSIVKEQRAKADVAKKKLRDLEFNQVSKKAVDIGTSAISKLFGKSKKKK